MLEMIHAYARDKLRAGEQLDQARQAHAEHYLRLALAARAHLFSGGDQAQWVNRLDTEHNNLRAALAWAIEDRSRADFALTLTEALYHFWCLSRLFERRPPLAGPGCSDVRNTDGVARTRAQLCRPSGANAR